MIYRDSEAKRDTNDIPGYRYDNCLIEMKNSIDGPFANYSVPDIECHCQMPGCQNCVPTVRP